MTESRKPLLNSSLRWFLAGMILANIAGQMLYSMLSLHMIDQLTPIYISDFGGLNVQQIGLLNAIGGLAIITASPLAGRIVDKVSERMSILTGFALQAIGLSFFLFTNGFPGFAAAMIFLGAGVGCTIPGYDSLISKVVPENKRGMAFGLFGTTLGILSLPFPWIGAQLWEKMSPQTPFGLVVAACLISIPIVWAKFKLPKPSIETAMQV